ncbi:sulfite exporter TauE/SafE family protein [Spongiibacter sp. KMU-158]|uniref:Sulfite exporter TauE/SafE family protein n=1 Tax=Spongiibacter pelagi TaxID=2760804 RepID=A0A927BZ19_9GAMM|nr:sulfite exporter TauE/SafE family protein [Spongiibacter pelagi]MBD2858208.1 sulfite exporter TauE/SafE family protein [Spongiibacter pelagi]
MITEALSYSAAFMLGLIGSPHCVGMCGGIAGVLANATPQQSASKTSEHYIPVVERQSHRSPPSQYGFLAVFQFGRLLSYSLLGLIAGGVISGIASLGQLALDDLKWITVTLRVLASLMLIAVAFSIAGWGQLSQRLEAMGNLLWKKIQPLTRALLPINNLGKAFSIGILWGFLPCGLIYSALAWSALSGSPMHAASLMFCFGLGTVPAVLSVSSIASLRPTHTSNPLIRSGFAIVLIIIALAPWFVMPANNHQHHSTPATETSAHPHQH